MKRICVLPGDGIGPEVVECAVDVLRSAGGELEFEYAEIGERAYRAVGTHLPDETLEMMRSCDSCLFGAVTSSDSHDYESPVLKFRRALELYAIVRPVRTLVRQSSRGSIDTVIVRESSEGMYSQNEVFDDTGVTTLRRVTRKASERIVDFAIDYALSHRRKSLCCVHKSNVLRSSDGLFLEVFREESKKKGGGLQFDEQLVDSAAMKIVTDPEGFDVIVTLNLYGDILSDIAAGVAGGLGFAPSASIGPKHSVFEPAHGS
ncbi:MAG: isocitrate/isopropylmalate dehydrogenase family protein, partial [Candidatus Thermoplasmatota archaeon]|nr:isocitrate/isopropylmalate dehydrogenase family protein [Candidatus Thermoplasmatota archaeon]